MVRSANDFTTGTIRGGKIEVDSGSLPEGAMVTVLALDGDETFNLNAADEARLLAAMAQFDSTE